MELRCRFHSGHAQDAGRLRPERNLYLPDALRELLSLKRRGILRATHFTWEITITPRSWAGELLRLHFNKHGILPLYNQPASALQLLRRVASPAPDLSLP